MKTIHRGLKTIILATSITFGLGVREPASAQLPVTVTSDVQGLLAYVQDAAHQVQDLAKWADQYVQMAEQIVLLTTQVEQYVMMLARFGDPATILGIIGLDGAVRSISQLVGSYQSLSGSLQSMGARFESLPQRFAGEFSDLGDVDAWINAAGASSAEYRSMNGYSVRETYGTRAGSDASVAQFAPVEKAFDSFVETAYKVRQYAQDGVSEVERLTRELETAVDQATVDKIRGALQVQSQIADSVVRLEEQAYRDVMAADVARRTDDQKHYEAAVRANQNSAAIVRGILVEEEMTRLPQQAQRRESVSQPGTRRRAPINMR